MVAIQLKILTPVGTAMTIVAAVKYIFSFDAHAGGEHVVRPDDEADHADRDHRISHAEIAEHRLAAEGRDDLADHAEARQDHDVDLGVAEEPEQMLVEHDVAAARRVEEGGSEIAVGEQHGDRAREHRQRQQQQEGGDQDRPDEQRHLVQGHARRAHVEDGGDEVDRAEDRAGAGEVEREDRHVDRRARSSPRSIAARRPSSRCRRRARCRRTRRSSRAAGRRPGPAARS